MYVSIVNNSNNCKCICGCNNKKISVAWPVCMPCYREIKRLEYMGDDNPHQLTTEEPPQFFTVIQGGVTDDNQPRLDNPDNPGYKPHLRLLKSTEKIAIEEEKTALVEPKKRKFNLEEDGEDK